MNCRETVYTQIKFELQERERLFSRLMGRERSTRSIMPRWSWVGKLETRLRSVLGNGTESVEEIQREIDNSRAARQWAVEQKRETEIATAFNSLWFFCDTRSWYREGEQAFRSVAEAFGTNGLDDEKSSLRGKILAEYRSLGFSSNRGATARKPFEESLAVLRRHYALAEAGFALLRLSEVAMVLENDPLVAHDYLRESLTNSRAVGYQWGIAYSLRWLGFVAFLLEEYEEGKRRAQEGLAIYQENSDRWGIATTLSVVGFCMLEQGEFVEAKRVGQECWALCTGTDLQWAALNGLLVIGAATCAMREYQEARRNLYEALELAVECQFMPYILAVLEEIAALMMNMGKRELAPAILAFLLHYPVPPLLGKRRTMRLIVKLQDELSTDVFAAAIERSRMLRLETLIEVCMDALQPDGRFSQVAQPLIEPLTNRELEVLQLIAAGLTNKEIATNLVVSVGTIKKHNGNIFGKLGIDSRTQAIVRARELNLVK